MEVDDFGGKVLGKPITVISGDHQLKRGGDSWFFITDNYAFGHSLERDASAIVTRNGRLREDNLMVHDLMLVEVKKPEESEYPWDYYGILSKISGEEAFGPPDPACALVKK